MENLLNGQPYYTAPETGAIYIPIPADVAALALGGEGCSCAFCKAHPDLPARWDTLVIPGGNDRQPSTFTVHMPELGAGNRPDWLQLGRK